MTMAPRAAARGSNRPLLVAISANINIGGKLCYKHNAWLVFISGAGYAQACNGIPLTLWSLGCLAACADDHLLTTIA